jgi:hypothetical protein
MNDENIVNNIEAIFLYRFLSLFQKKVKMNNTK